MPLKVEDLDNEQKFRQILVVKYTDLVLFIVDNLKKINLLMAFFYFLCVAFLGVAIYSRIILISVFPFSKIILHSFFGLLVMPFVSILVHEALHVIPLYLSGARNIRVGMDLKQYMFYVTAHKYVASPVQFLIVALTPFVLISIAAIYLIITLPPLWQWSFSLFLFIHSTLCAGDFALVNFYYINRKKTIYTWDDVDNKIAYFYESIST
jgi:hypothetical protein